MNRPLAEAVVASFQADESEAVRELFVPFSERDWKRTTKWLHRSGLALYFLDRMTGLGTRDVMPSALVRQLSINLAENRVRTSDMFEEFVRLNKALMRGGISYLNVKGFSLAPAAFADPALRYLLDFDFLVTRRDIERCARVMESLGYMVKVASGNTWEFCAGTPVRTSMRNLYRVRPVKSVEVHIVSEVEEARAQHGGDRMSRMQLQVLDGFEFPALGDADKLLLQASHLFQHFQWQWTRTSWLLEYSNAVRSHRDNPGLWRDVAAAVDAAPETRIGVALASLVTSQTFGTDFPREFTARTVDLLKPEVRLWVEHYGRDLVFTDHPGSKLYLLLLDVLQADQPQWTETRRKRLLPLHLPPKVMLRTNDSLRMRWLTATTQLQFTAERLLFHMKEGVRYKRQAARWRRLVAKAELKGKEV
jgi:putative nucleotidyltransferase-like protein